MNITVTYIAKWQLKNNTQYKWTECKKLVNDKTGNEIKRTLKGMIAGYWIGKTFIPLSKLKEQIELIPEKEYCPF